MAFILPSICNCIHCLQGTHSSHHRQEGGVTTFDKLPVPHRETSKHPHSHLRLLRFGLSVFSLDRGRKNPHTQWTKFANSTQKDPGCQPLHNCRTKHCNCIMRRNGKWLQWKSSHWEEVSAVPVKVWQFSLLPDKLLLNLLPWVLRGLGLASWRRTGKA